MVDHSIPKNEKLRWWLNSLFILYAVVSPISLSATNVILGIIILGNLILIFGTGEPEQVRVPAKLLIAFSLLFLWSIVSRLLSGNPLDQKAFSNIWEYSPVVLLPTFLSITEVKKERIIIALLASSSIVSLLGLIQYFSPSMIYPFPRQLAPGHFQGFFSNRLHTGGFYSIITVLSFSLILFWKCGTTRKAFLWIFFILNFTALVLSMTRSYYIAMPLTILILMLVKSRRLFALGLSIFALFLTLIFAFPNPIKDRLQTITDPNYSSNVNRIYMWKAAIEMAKDHPLIGVGYGNWEKAARERYFPPIEKEYHIVFDAYAHAHNIYLTRLAETGIIGLFLFMLFWLSVAWALYRSINKTQKEVFEHALIIGALASLGNLFLAGMFENNFGTSVIVLLISFLIGLSLDLKPKSLQMEG